MMLATAHNTSILRALEEGPKGQAELSLAADRPAQSTLRAQLKRLVAIGALEKHRRNRFPGVLEYELTQPGIDLLPVIDTLDRWLEMCPEGSLGIGGNSARATVRAFADGWSSTMLRAIATGPRTLTELDRLIGGLNYPALERRLGAMRSTGLVAAHSGNGRGTPYAATGWLRHAVAPLTAAMRWERSHRPEATAPLRRLDVESLFLLAMPLLEPPSELDGTCRMGAELPNGKGARIAGVVVAVRDGRIASCSTELHKEADAWALGPAGAWLDAMIDRDRDRLELGGDCALARSLLDLLHRSLFATHSAPSSSAGA